MLGLGVLEGAANFSTGNPGLDFFYTLFNGISEIPLFSSPINGILILAVVILASRTAGLMIVLLGLICAGMAILFGAPYGTQYTWYYDKGKLSYCQDVKQDGQFCDPSEKERNF